MLCMKKIIICFLVSSKRFVRRAFFTDSGHSQIGAREKKSTKHGVGTKTLFPQVT